MSPLLNCRERRCPCATCPNPDEFPVLLLGTLVFQPVALDLTRETVVAVRIDLDEEPNFGHREIVDEPPDLELGLDGESTTRQRFTDFTLWRGFLIFPVMPPNWRRQAAVVADEVFVVVPSPAFDKFSKGLRLEFPADRATQCSFKFHRQSRKTFRALPWPRRSGQWREVQR